MSDTRVRRIDITNDIDLKEAIEVACNLKLKQGFHLASSFESRGQVILIFQRTTTTARGGQP